MSTRQTRDRAFIGAAVQAVGQLAQGIASAVKKKKEAKRQAREQAIASANETANNIESAFENQSDIDKEYEDRETLKCGGRVRSRRKKCGGSGRRRCDVGDEVKVDENGNPIPDTEETTDTNNDTNNPDNYQSGSAWNTESDVEGISKGTATATNATLDATVGNKNQGNKTKGSSFKSRGALNQPDYRDANINNNYNNDNNMYYDRLKQYKVGGRAKGNLGLLLGKGNCKGKECIKDNPETATFLKGLLAGGLSGMAAGRISSRKKEALGGGNNDRQEFRKGGPKTWLKLIREGVEEGRQVVKRATRSNQAAHAEHTTSNLKSAGEETMKAQRNADRAAGAAEGAAAASATAGSAYGVKKYSDYTNSQTEKRKREAEESEAKGKALVEEANKDREEKKKGMEEGKSNPKSVSTKSSTTSNSKSSTKLAESLGKKIRKQIESEIEAETRGANDSRKLRDRKKFGSQLNRRRYDEGGGR